MDVVALRKAVFTGFYHAGSMPVFAMNGFDVPRLFPLVMPTSRARVASVAIPGTPYPGCSEPQRFNIEAVAPQNAYTPQKDEVIYVAMNGDNVITAWVSSADYEEALQKWGEGLDQSAGV